MPRHLGARSSSTGKTSAMAHGSAASRRSPSCAARQRETPSPVVSSCPPAELRGLRLPAQVSSALTRLPFGIFLARASRGETQGRGCSSHSRPGPPQLGSAARAPAAARDGCNAAGCAPAALGPAAARGGTAVNTERFQTRLSWHSSLLLADQPSGRQVAREPLDDELWTRRALLAASASRCSSWCSAASARGSR